MNSRNTSWFFIAAAAVLAAFNLYGPIPIYGFILLAVAWLGINAWGSIFVSSQFFMPVVCRRNKPGNAIALTFDDGPSPGQTERVLAILAQAGVKATFFCIGKNVDAHPALATQMHQAGHLLGNHSYFHGKLFDLQSPTGIVQELMATDAAIKKITGKRPLLFRPPYGVTNPMLAAAVKRTKHTTVGWAVRSFDTATSNPQEVFNRVKKNVTGGDILLFHDRCEVTIEVLPQILELLEQKGLKIVPLDELINQQPYAD